MVLPQEKRLDPLDSIAFRGGPYIPEFLRKPIATCNFQEGSEPPASPPPSGFAQKPSLTWSQALNKGFSFLVNWFNVIVCQQQLIDLNFVLLI